MAEWDFDALKLTHNSAQENKRFHELDAMRGLAAIVVVLHHFRLMFYRNAFSKGIPWIFLHPFVAGHEAVMFFFLLSGFVLAVPRTRGKNQAYSVFIGRRLLRIYGPYIVALVLSVAGCAMLFNPLATSGWNCPVRLGPVIQHVLFIGSYDYGQYNTALWSLVYEMRISIVFPAMYFVAAKLGTKLTLLLMLVLTVIGVQVDSQTVVTIEYAGVFLVGILLAQNIGAISVFYKRLGTVQRSLLLMAFLLLYNESYRLQSTPLWHLGVLPIVLGACGLMVSGMNSTMISRALNSSAPAFLGRISYSLYLVHGTVLFALAALLQNRVNHPTLFILYLASAIILGWGFYYAVEAPFMRMSRRVGGDKDGQPISADLIEVPALVS